MISVYRSDQSLREYTSSKRPRPEPRRKPRQTAEYYKMPLTMKYAMHVESAQVQLQELKLMLSETVNMMLIPLLHRNWACID